MERTRRLKLHAVVLLAKKHAQEVKCEHMELAGIVSSQICAFLSVTSVQTSRVELVDKQFINPCTLNKEHMEHYAFKIKEYSEHNLHLRLNLSNWYN